MSASLREHQLAMLEILSELDRVCAAEGIPYMLFAGTLLGAVRHRGFIPWDDDLDVVMLRPDYERFLNSAGKVLDNDRFFLQAEFSEHWPMFFSKLRMNGTACMEKCVPRDPKQHQGVYVDIFPIDNLADNRAIRKLQFAASKVVIAKSLRKRGYLTDDIGKKLFMTACRVLPAAPFRKLAMRRKDGNSRMLHSFFGASSKFEKSVYARQWLTESEPMPFEGATFPGSAHYDDLLTTLYGDYMTPPAEEELKCKVHAAKVDLENSYEMYLDWQRQQSFTEYTRSIR